MADWSSLPSDVLCLLSDLLPFAGDFLFRCVCKSWHSAVPRRPLHPIYLIANHRDNSSTLAFFNLPCIEMRALEITGHCRGSAHGWLALLLADEPSITLFNPILHRRIKLPSFSQETARFDTNKVLLSSDPSSMWWSLSSSSSSSSSSSVGVVLAIRHDWKMIQFCRVGDNYWNVIKFAMFEGPINDAVFYNGKFYIAAYDSLYVCDVGNEPRIRKVRVQGWRRAWTDDCYLVEVGGDLVMVTLNFGTDKTYGITGFKLNWRGDDRVSLERAQELGGFAVFLSRTQSVSFSTTRFGECKGDCAYVVEYYMENEILIRIFDLKNQCCELVTNPSSVWRPCTWFTPSQFV